MTSTIESTPSEKTTTRVDQLYEEMTEGHTPCDPTTANNFRSLAEMKAEREEWSQLAVRKQSQKSSTRALAERAERLAKISLSLNAVLIMLLVVTMLRTL